MTAGLLVSREVYGEQVNRWYARGLPVLSKKKWEVIKIDAYKAYDRWRAPRARRAGGLVLVPPEVWKMRRADRRTVQRCLERAASPEAAIAAIAVVAELVAKVAKPITVSAVPKSALELERQREFNVRMSGREASARTDESVSDLTSPLPRGEGYISSEHSNCPDHAGARAGPALTRSVSSVPPEWMKRELELEASRKASTEALARRHQNKLHQALERLKTKLLGGK